MSRKRFLIATPLTFALLALAAYLGMGYVLYDRLTSIRAGGGANNVNTPAAFAYHNATQFDTTPYFMPDYEVASFTSRQTEITLAGWYIPGDPAMPVVIITHGIHSCKCSPEVLIPAGMLHERGFAVFLYDMRNHGESEIDNGRTALGNKEYLDTLGAWDWLQTTKGFAPEKIGLLGNSLGAGTTLIAFAEEPRVAAAFLDSPYSNLPQIITEELERNRYPTFLEPGGILMGRLVGGDDLLAHSPEDAIRRGNHRPLFIVHGTGDTRISVHHTQQLQTLAQAEGANLTVWMPEGIEHVSASTNLTAEYETRLIEFFSQTLIKQ
jgi:dipeptidyl aminopeptidase/acylaminoacyl peptidase